MRFSNLKQSRFAWGQKKTGENWNVNKHWNERWQWCWWCWWRWCYQDGAFVVRRRQTDADDGSPYALTLAFDGQIYHMLIRRRDTGKFSLGTERRDQHVRDPACMAAAVFRGVDPYGTGGTRPPNISSVISATLYPCNIFLISWKSF